MLKSLWKMMYQGTRTLFVPAANNVRPPGASLSREQAKLIFSQHVRRTTAERIELERNPVYRETIEQARLRLVARVEFGFKD